MRIIGDIGLSMHVARFAAGKAARTIKIGTVYPATIGVLPAFRARIGGKFPDVALHMKSGSTGGIIRSIERRGSIASRASESGQSAAANGDGRARLVMAALPAGLQPVLLV
ncbi:hypothetical protein M2267_004578 [Ensifer sp. KUDG1]